jgi:hypothetical protein
VRSMPSLALAEFHARLKRHGVDRANIKEYRHEFDRVALGYLDTKHKGFSAWLDGAKDSKGTVESPFINTKGKCYTKRDCEALVRALRKKRVEAFEKTSMVPIKLRPSAPSARSSHRM